jgi:hypothetical protein
MLNIYSEYIMIFNYLNFKWFLISMAIGLFYIYIAEEYKTTILIYPTPDKLQKYQYRDKTDNCFSYDLEEVDCTANVNNIPIQR